MTDRDRALALARVLEAVRVVSVDGIAADRSLEDDWRGIAELAETTRAKHPTLAEPLDIVGHFARRVARAERKASLSSSRERDLIAERRARGMPFDEHHLPEHVRRRLAEAMGPLDALLAERMH